MLLGSNLLELAVADVGDGEVLEDARVRVSEVGVLDLEVAVVGSIGDEALDLLGHISAAVEGTEDDELGGAGVELLVLGDRDTAQDSVEGVDHVEELGGAG